MRRAVVMVLGTLVVGTLGCGADPEAVPSSTGASGTRPGAPAGKIDVPEITTTSASSTTAPPSSTSSTTSVPVVDNPRTPSSGG